MESKDTGVGHMDENLFGSVERMKYRDTYRKPRY